MATYELIITLQGATNSDRTTKRFVLDAPDYVSASVEADQVRGALVDITKANIRRMVLSEVLLEDGTLPADNSADTFERAKVFVYTNATGDAEKLAAVEIPAPEEVLFIDGEIVDINNALLQQYIQQLAQHTTVSDGETINTAEGAGGMKNGYKVTKARNFKSS